MSVYQVTGLREFIRRSQNALAARKMGAGLQSSLGRYQPLPSSWLKTTMITGTVVRELLSEEGYPVIAVPNGVEALRALQTVTAAGCSW